MQQLSFFVLVTDGRLHETDPVAALKRVAGMLRNNGRIYCTQTLETTRNRVLELLKPWFKFVTTIDFGNVTYRSEVNSELLYSLGARSFAFC